MREEKRSHSDEEGSIDAEYQLHKRIFFSTDRRKKRNVIRVRTRDPRRAEEAGVIAKIAAAQGCRAMETDRHE